MDNGKANLLIIGFITIIIGAVLFSSEVNTISQSTNLNTADHESITITSGSGDLANTRISSLSFFGNGTNNTVNATRLSIGSHINISRNGTIQVAQNFNVTPTDESGENGLVFGNGAYRATYTYEGANYITDASSRNVTALIPIFLALMIMAVGVGIAVLGFKDTFGDMF